MGRAIFLGLTTVDVVSYVKSYPDSNEKVRVDDRRYLVGGPAANAAITFAQLGGEATLISAVGRHPLAELAKDEFKKHTISLIDMAAGKTSPPVVSMVTVDCSTGNRSVIYPAPEENVIKFPEISEERLGGTRVVMLDCFFPAAAEKLCRVVKSSDDVQIVLDCGSWKEGMDVLFKTADYSICSQDFFPPGIACHNDVGKYFREFGVEYVAVTRGGNSLLGFEFGKQYEIPVPQVEVVDTLGAGDVFHGAFSYYIGSNGFRKSLEQAVRVASESCTRKGPRMQSFYQ